jgi:hypothetical protein
MLTVARRRGGFGAGPSPEIDWPLARAEAD